jgi:hypothetical protein
MSASAKEIDTATRVLFRVAKSSCYDEMTKLIKLQNFSQH